MYTHTCSLYKSHLFVITPRHTSKIMCTHKMGVRLRMLMIVLTMFEMFFSLSATSNNMTTSKDMSFNLNYYVTWGKDRFLLFKHGREVQLSLDQSSGQFFSCKLKFYFVIRVFVGCSCDLVTIYYILPLLWQVQLVILSYDKVVLVSWSKLLNV